MTEERYLELELSEVVKPNHLVEFLAQDDEEVFQVEMTWNELLQQMGLV